MPLRFLLDEDLRGWALWQAIRRHNAVNVDPIDVARVGDPVDLPLGTKDPDVLIWAERCCRIVVSRDESTMKSHLAIHLRAGHGSPGLFLMRKRSRLFDVVDFLVAGGGIRQRAGGLAGSVVQHSLTGADDANASV
ncbi:MAG TPA: hypothetical protein DDY78_16405 [Planctomycetales bacterium]|nr:hypothetical protein [Planctomycetales bacterium]